MQICKTTIVLREFVSSARHSGARIGFVPTMGYLHEGHISLVRQAKGLCDKVVVSIFVNPTQFNDKKDFEKYPIDLDQDSALLSAAGADALFLPDVSEIYPPGFQSWVELGELTKLWEGQFRPGHFRGVSTVVSILFNCVKPDVALFGEKDFQQLRVIERMVSDLKMGIEIVRGKTVREASGLAMSSRNVSELQYQINFAHLFCHLVYVTPNYQSAAPLPTLQRLRHALRCLLD